MNPLIREYDPLTHRWLLFEQGSRVLRAEVPAVAGEDADNAYARLLTRAPELYALLAEVLDAKVTLAGLADRGRALLKEIAP
jgi:hypothetical protein